VGDVEMPSQVARAMTRTRWGRPFGEEAEGGARRVRRIVADLCGAAVRDGGTAGGGWSEGVMREAAGRGRRCREGTGGRGGVDPGGRDPRRNRGSAGPAASGPWAQRDPRLCPLSGPWMLSDSCSGRTTNLTTWNPGGRSSVRGGPGEEGRNPADRRMQPGPARRFLCHGPIIPFDRAGSRPCWGYATRRISPGGRPSATLPGFVLPGIPADRALGPRIRSRHATPCLIAPQRP